MLVFVYGTLTDRERADAVIGPGNYEFVGRARLEGVHRVEGVYPTLAPGGSVDGRLLETDREGIGVLDAYEGVDRELYVRVAVPIVGGDTAWSYVGDPARLEVMEDVTWPGEGTFRDNVRSTVIDQNVTIESLE